MTTPLWQSDEVVRAVDGKTSTLQNWQASNVAIDSRTVQPGDLFVALKGPVFDGHDFVASALNAGAVGAIVSETPKDIAETAPLVHVRDTFTALEQLGHASRQRTQARLVAVTGSVGKTGTKEMLRLMLSVTGETYANEGSFNNQWGVPLSLARMPADARFGVFELGMNHPGELGPLAAQVEPHVAMITNIEAVHLEFFPSVEAIADAKAEIFLGTKADGAAVLNRENVQFTRLEKAARDRGIRNVLNFGYEDKCDARLVECRPLPNGSEITVEIMGAKVSYHLGAPGEHLAFNSVGALLAAVAAGGNTSLCAAALAQYMPPKGRGGTQTVTLPEGSITVIDESYNASPAAVRAAIKVLAALPQATGRRIMALGDMRELGASSPALHAELAKDLADAKIDRVYCCGEMMAHLYNALPLNMRGAHAKDSAALAPQIAADLQPGDIITVKGSKAVGMPVVIEAILALGAAKKQKRVG